MDVGLTVDAAGTLVEFKSLLDILNDFDIKSTFFAGVKIKPDLLKIINKNGHEVGNHTFSHPVSILKLDNQDKNIEIISAHLWLNNILNQTKKNVEIKGFRAPYYNFDPNVIKILEKNEYLWDSTKGYFPLLGKHFKAEKIGKIIELPSLFPDDSTL
jgi:peptidoglycan/xylan/chitin deacetylase (PgdA/CDA1 family)